MNIVGYVCVFVVYVEVHAASLPYDRTRRESVFGVVVHVKAASFFDRSNRTVCLFHGGRGRFVIDI
jgi:hypothetical protein